MQTHSNWSFIIIEIVKVNDKAESKYANKGNYLQLLFQGHDYPSNLLKVSPT